MMISRTKQSAALAASVLVAAGAITALASAGGSDTSPLPAFSTGPTSAWAKLPAPAKAAFAEAGAPQDAPVKTVGAGPGQAIAIPGTEPTDHTYVGLYNPATQRAAVIDAPAGAIKDKSGTWVASQIDGEQYIAALVPDGVSSVSVAGQDGRASSVPVTGNIAVIKQAGVLTVSFNDGKANRTTQMGVPTLPPVNP